MRLIIYGDIGGSGGYVRYCKGLLASNAIPNDIEVWFVCSSNFYKKLAPLDSNIKVIVHPWIDSKLRIKRYLWHLFIYPNLIRKIKPDIEFYPSGQLRLFMRKALTVATCHNLLLFDEKELNRFDNKTERKYFIDYRKRQISSFLKSDAMIFLSKHSQKIVCNVLPKIVEHTVISHGLDTMFLQPHERDFNFRDEIKILYVSPIFYYKHQKEVVEAIKTIRISTNQNIVLQLVGGGNTIAATELKELIKNENSQNFIRLTDFINSDDLLKEYISADVFIFASASETFGITILEAMGAKLPIACSDKTGLSEILQDAGVYFNPEDTSSIIDALMLLLEDKDLRQNLGEKAFKYSTEYTWEKCATKTFNYIKDIYEKH